jgi:hypothetical protein
MRTLLGRSQKIDRRNVFFSLPGRLTHHRATVWCRGSSWRLASVLARLEIAVIGVTPASSARTRATLKQARSCRLRDLPAVEGTGHRPTHAWEPVGRGRTSRNAPGYHPAKLRARATLAGTR